MKKIISILIISLFIISCSNEEKMTDADKISSYKHQIKELEQKIQLIEEENALEDYSGLKIPVRVESVQLQNFSHSFTAAGELESISEAFISPEVNGQIVKINVKEGQKVKKGDMLARLNTVVIDENIVEAKVRLDLAKTVYEKQEQLWKKNIGSEIDYLQKKNNYESARNALALLKAQKDFYTIESPINGIVEDIMFKEGELASPGMQLMQIVNLDEMKVNVKLSEVYLPVIKSGDMVNITFPSYPELKYREKVWRTGNVINKQNRTFDVEIKLNNEDGLLKPNMLATVRINDYNAENAIVLPSILIREDMTGSFIFIVEKQNENNIAVKKYIKTGKSYRDRTEVLEGVTAGDIIITDGYNNVSKGAVVNIID